MQSQVLTPEQFMQKLAAAHQAFAVPENSQPAACVCLVLDHAERLREQYGYSGLLKLLRELRLLMTKVLGSECQLCALNERTLLALLPGCSIQTAAELVTGLFEQIDAEAFGIGRETAALSVSLGYCEFDHRFPSVDRLLIELVDGTQQTTATGGNAVIRVEPDLTLGQVSSSERQMLALLMEALRKNTLRVFFQPLMATAAEREKSFQVLPRLAAPDGSLIAAAGFVPIARKARVLGVMDRWMLQRTVQLLAKEYQLLPVRLFLSQGESLLVDARRRQWLDGLLAKNPAVSGKLVLDFSVEDVLAHSKSSVEFVRQAHGLGIQICFSQLDDHSKWDWLSRHLRPDYLKMSAAFVGRLCSDPELESEFQRLSWPIRRQGSKIIMPMVEDANVAANLWRTGADYLQGYLIERETERLNLND